MYGVSKINIEPSLMMISVQDVEFKGNSLARYLQIFADNGVVVDMISQSAPHGTTIDFSFTAAGSDLPLVMKAISAANLDKDAKASPLISVGYSKQESAKYDVSCSSSGTVRSGKAGMLGNTVGGWGICHSFAEDGRCISLLKVMLTNYCIYDCAYCINRRSNASTRAH